MADSKFDICNKAMVLVGANTITSFTENTTESKVAGQLYESTLENLITRCRWRFASKQLQLSKIQPILMLDMHLHMLYLVMH